METEDKGFRANHPFLFWGIIIFLIILLIGVVIFIIGLAVPNNVPPAPISSSSVPIKGSSGQIVHTSSSAGSA